MNAQLKPEPETGIFYDVPESEYHKKTLGELSSSAAKQMLRSPAHYKAYIEAEDDDSTPSKEFGKAFHCAIFEPARFLRDYAVLPEDAPRKPSITQRQAKKPSDETIVAIQWWDAFTAAGRKVISQDDMTRILGMQASVQAHPWARRLLEGCETEVTIRWIDEATGVHCKARADSFKEMKKRYVVDAKSCVDASPEKFSRSVYEYGYHIQHAHYCKGFAAIGKPLDNYFILAVESEAPFVCQVYHIDAAAEARGYELTERAASRLQECIEANKWPGYSEDINALSLPPWALKD